MTGSELVMLQDNREVSTDGWSTCVFASSTLFVFRNSSGVFRYNNGHEKRLPLNSSVFAYDCKDNAVVFAEKNVVRRLNVGGTLETLFLLQYPVVLLQVFDGVVLSLCAEGRVFVDDAFLMTVPTTVADIPVFATRNRADYSNPETFVIALLTLVFGALVSIIVLRRHPSTKCCKLRPLLPIHPYMATTALET